ncbi:uncharacterized protein E0L32_000351 [Thyridium curvatum]|uniref:Uncharacterized protein n=1 Tax=Thyridium curvatum TaxID=1093900 RepID=A0A507B873_9PEZI|nr:uncharacterized protein E0L32_000351 [Thyridium curvatum]TPX16017.1 hypothetical protein E0L32_000351 [Thyridium curvatum]
MSVSNVYGQGEPKQGWTSSPDSRGTLDILWGSSMTSFLCCWSILCINVPPREDSRRVVLTRKLLMALATLFAPECIVVVAFGQYLSARRSVKDFAAAGISHWTMRHAFVADMGAFLLQTPDWLPFPVNAQQLLWLIQHNYIEIPRQQIQSIIDKNKADGFMRLIMAAQTIWFCVNIVGRLAQGLAITAIEVTTVAFIYCGLSIMFFWRHKPAGVETVEILHSRASLADILIAGGDAARHPYYETPLDFINRKEWAWSKYLAHCRQAISGRFKAHRKPANHISSLTTPEIPFNLFRLGTIGVMGYCCLFIPPWNSSFPTLEEQLLWRVSTVGCLASLVTMELLTDWVFYLWPAIQRRWRTSRRQSNREREPTGDSGVRRAHEISAQAGQQAPTTMLWNRLRNNSPSKDPDLAIPLKVVVALWVSGLIYTVCRVYILVEDFVELRALPASAFKTVDWSQAFPHMG